MISRWCRINAEPALTLHGYWRSSASYRVRLALAIKGLDYHSVPVSLIADGGQQHQPRYQTLNPQALVPTLVVDQQPLTQSLAIIEYLDERYPDPALLPRDPLQRAQVRAVAMAIACDIAPLANLRVIQRLQTTGQSAEAVQAWIQHWIESGLRAVEALLPKDHGPFCFGTQLSVADCCLLPQVYNAERYACDLSELPRIQAITAALRAEPALAGAHPEAQEDAPATG